MEIVTRDNLAQLNLTNEAILEYIGTLAFVDTTFPANGEYVINQGPGYNSRNWVESLFAVAAQSGCFRSPSMPIEKALPFAAIQPLITKNLVAEICLTSDIVQTLYYEYQLLCCRKIINEATGIPRQTKKLLVDLRKACLEFNRQKQKYLRIAYCGKVPRKARKLYDLNPYTRHSVWKTELITTFAIMPAVFEICPRQPSADILPISNLCCKYSRLFAFCEEVITSISV